MTTASHVSIHRERKSVARTVAVSVAVVTTRIRRHHASRASRVVRAARTGRTVRAVTEDASVRMVSVRMVSRMANRMVSRMASSRSRTANNRISGDSPEP